jgi:hypothetical protein
MTKEETIQRGQRARLLLEDTLLIEILDGLEKTYIEAWEKSAETETAYREKLWGLHKLTKELRVQLNIIAQGSKITQAQLDKLKK